MFDILITLDRRLHQILITRSVAAFLSSRCNVHHWLLEGFRDFMETREMKLPVTQFDGVLSTDESDIVLASNDYGNIIHKIPLAVLKPNSITDICKLVQFARSNKLKIVARGFGHSVHGQAQVAKGIVIDMRCLTKIHSISKASALVNAGISWHDLLLQTLRTGQTPPVLTDYLGLSIGGTISIGGIGAQTFKYGAQSDNITEMEVVVGTGDIVKCSPTQNRELFHACRAGLGQFGIITAVRTLLVQAPQKVRFYRLIYTSRTQFLHDLLLLTDKREYDGLSGTIIPNNKHSLKTLIGDLAEKLEVLHKSYQWLYTIKVSIYYNQRQQYIAELPSDLDCTKESILYWDMDYFTYAARLDSIDKMPVERNKLAATRPWINLMVSDTIIDEFLDNILLMIKAEDYVGHILVYSFQATNIKTPFFCTPAGQRIIKLGFLRTTYVAGSQSVADAMTMNRRLYEYCQHRGGICYPIDSVSTDQSDWQRQFGIQWREFVINKRRFDPDNIFTSVQPIL